jgi:DNA-binding Xre family transcriptional regulator
MIIVIEVSYDKLFAYLYKHGISKSEMSKKTGVSRNTIIKMTKGELVHLSVIIAICEVYGFELEDIVEIKK